MATITVGPSGRDYTAIQDAVGAAANGDTIAVYAGTYTRIGTGAIVDGPAVSKTGIWLRPMEAGVILDGQNTNRYGIIANTDWTIGSPDYPMTIQDTALWSVYSGGVVGNVSSAGASGPTGVTIQRVVMDAILGRPVTRLGSGTLIDRCTFRDCTYGIWIQYGTIRRCLFIGVGEWMTQIVDSTGIVEQCGALNTRNSGINGGLTAYTVQNCWVYSPSGYTLPVGVADVTHVHNAILGTVTLPIYGGATPDVSEIVDATPTIADYFTDAGNEDFSLPAGSPLIDAGMDLSASFATDADGDTYTTWDIGPQAFVVPAPDPEPTGTEPGWESYWLTDDGPPAGTPSGWDAYPESPTPTIQYLVIATLLSDARADVSEVPAGQQRRGWWGDAYGEPAGSLLWTLPLRGVTADTPAQAEQYARAALQWLIDDGHATAIAVTAEIQGQRLALEVTVTRARDGETERITLPDVWGGYRG